MLLHVDHMGGLSMGDSATIAPLAKTAALKPPPMFAATAAVSTTAKSPIRAAFVSPALSSSASSAPSPVVSAFRPSATDCGPEPPRKPANASGARMYVDPTAGAAYDACYSAKLRAAEKARYDAVVGRRAGGADGCGDEPPFALSSSGQKFYTGDTGGGYTGADLARAWGACRASAGSSGSSGSSGASTGASSGSSGGGGDAWATPDAGGGGAAPSGGGAAPSGGGVATPSGGAVSSAAPAGQSTPGATGLLLAVGALALVAGGAGLYFALR